MFTTIQKLVKPLNIKCWFNTLFFVLFINTNLFLKLITNNSFIHDLNIELQRSRYSLFERINYIREDFKSIKLLNFLLKQDEPKLKTELKSPENRNCSNMPFFELFIINFLNRLGLNVMDMFYMDFSSVYLYYSIYYTYSILPDISYVTANLFSATNNKHRLNKIEEYFLQDELKKLDVLVVSHYDYNHQLTTYFNALKVVLDTLPEPPIGIKVNNINENITELKFNNTNGNNYINRRFYLFACLLRNYNADKQQKTILAFISNINGNQYIIHDLRKKNIIQKFNWLSSSNKFTNEELEITKKGFTYKYNFSKGEKLLLYLNITDKDELLKEENDKRIEFCREIDVIPQFGGTCWFNAILMAVLYSQGSRRILLDKTKEKDWGKDDSLLMVLKTILYSSHSSDTVKRNNLKTLFSKLKPEAIMLKTLDFNKYAKDDIKTHDFNKYAKEYIKKSLNKNLKINLKKIFSFGFSIIFILSFLKRLNLTFIEFVIQINGNGCILNYYTNSVFKYSETDTKIQVEIDYNKEREKKILDELSINTPDYLIILKEPTDTTIDSIQAEQYFTADEIRKIKRYDDIISFKGSDYKLDSCLINNYNHDLINSGHAIAGITCGKDGNKDGNKFMYNGWLRGDKPCPLFPYDWTATNINSFCFDQNDKCKLHVADQFDEEKDLCFSFEYGERVFIYVKLDIPQATNSIIRSNVNINSLSNLSHLVDDMYDYLDTYSRDEIIALLDYLNYTDIEDIQDKPTNELLKKLKYIIKHNYFNVAVKPIEISQQPSAPPSERSRRSRRQKPPPTPLEQPLEQPSAPPLEQPLEQPLAPPLEQPSAPPSERSRRSRRLKPPPQPLEQILEQPSAQPSEKSRRSRRQKQPSAPPSEKNTKLSRSRIQPQPLEKPSAQPTARRRMLPYLQRQQISSIQSVI